MIPRDDKSEDECIAASQPWVRGITCCLPKHGNTTLGMSLCSCHSHRAITIRLGPTDVILDDSRRTYWTSEALQSFPVLLVFHFVCSVVSRILLNAARNRLGRRDPVIERSTDESMLFRLQRFLNPSSQHGVSRYLRRVYLFAGITLRNREVWLCTRRWAQECEGIYQMQEVEG